ncbi:hypothetical protein [Sphingobacterium hungaricum]
MKYYLNLQFQLWSRQIQETGVPVFFAGLILLGLLILLNYLFTVYPIYAPYAVALIGLQIMGFLSNHNRNEFLKTAFPTKEYYKIRAIENLLFASPFLILLVIHAEFLVATGFLILSVLMLFLKIKAFNQKAIPTPFKKKPFEFIIGFRNNWATLLILYILFSIGLSFDNFNLGLVCMALAGLSQIRNYDLTESEFYVWNYSMKPKEFLLFKLKRACIQLSAIVFPMLLALIIRYPSYGIFSLCVLLICCIAISFFITVKYAVFPRAIQIPEYLLFCIGIVLLPLAFFLFPYYFNKASQNLKSIL